MWLDSLLRSVRGQRLHPVELPPEPRAERAERALDAACQVISTTGKAAIRLARDELNDDWEEELGMGEEPWNPAGEDGPDV
jgi:hypothetical protein